MRQDVLIHCVVKFELGKIKKEGGQTVELQGELNATGGINRRTLQTGRRMSIRA